MFIVRIILYCITRILHHSKIRVDRNERNAFKRSRKRGDLIVSDAVPKNLVAEAIFPSGITLCSLTRLRRGVAHELTKFVKQHKEASA